MWYEEGAEKLVVTSVIQWGKKRITFKPLQREYSIVYHI